MAELTISLAPVGIVYGMFKMQVPPAAGSIIISEPDIRLAGGAILLRQFAGTFQLPLPVNVYEGAVLETKSLMSNENSFWLIENDVTLSLLI